MSSRGTRGWVWVFWILAALVVTGVVAKNKYGASRSLMAVPSNSAPTPGLIRVTPRNLARPLVSPTPRKAGSPADTTATLVTTDRTTTPRVADLPSVRDLQLAALDPRSSPSVQALLTRLTRPGNASLPILGEVLKSESAELARLAAIALRGIGTPEAAHVLIQTIAEETDASRRENLEAVLATWSDPRAAEAFVEALHNNDDPRSREVIAGSLSAMLTGEMAESLLQQFGKADADADFRLGVAATLSRTQSEAVALVLAAYFNSAADDTAVRYFADAVAQIGSRAVVASVLDAYRRIGTNENSDYFLQAIGGVTNPAAVSAFAEALGRPNDQTDAWKLAAIGLSGMGTPEAVDALLREARNAQEDSERQKTLINNLSSVKNPDSLERLVNGYAANEEDPALARALAQAILNCGDDAIIRQFGAQRGQEYIDQFKKALETEK